MNDEMFCTNGIITPQEYNQFNSGINQKHNSFTPAKPYYAFSFI